MTLTLPVNQTGDGMGFGLYQGVHSDLGATTSGDFATAYLYYLDSLSVRIHVAAASCNFNASSNTGVLRWGFAYDGSPFAVGLGMRGAALGTVLSAHVVHTDPSFVFMESADFVNLFTHDPVTGAGDAILGSVAHDPMLDLILAAVRRSY